MLGLDDGTDAERFRTYVVDPLTRCLGFGVPGEEALEACARYAPLVEVGAGTGYWAAVLRARGVEVEAFDLHPPDQRLQNEFFSRTFTDAAPGAGIDHRDRRVFLTRAEARPLRAGETEVVSNGSFLNTTHS